MRHQSFLSSARDENLITTELLYLVETGKAEQEDNILVANDQEKAFTHGR